MKPYILSKDISIEILEEGNPHALKISINEFIHSTQKRIYDIQYQQMSSTSYDNYSALIIYEETNYEG